MQKEPAAIIEMLRQAFTWAVQGLVLFEVFEFTREQHAWLTLGTSSTLGLILWYMMRSEVWAPAGAPTHPPTEAAWREKVAAAEAAAAHALATQKAEYEAKLAATAAVADGEFAVSGPAPAAPAPLAQETHEAKVDTVNPGQEP